MNGSEFSSVADQTLRKRTDNGSTCIVLSRPKSSSDPTTITLSDGSTGFLFADGGFSAFHCEWQVWKRSKNGALTLFLDPESESSVAEPHGTVINGIGRLESFHEVDAGRMLVGGENGEDDVSEGSTHSSLEEAAVTSSMAESRVNENSESHTMVERALRSRVAYSERPSKSLNPSAPREDSIRMANIAMCNDRVYCTIDCMKGLKVQALSIICVIRIGNKIFASAPTSFPPPSSLKRKERSRVSKPKRSSPYKKLPLGTMDEFDDLDDLDDIHNMHSASPISSTAHAIPNEKNNGMRPRKTPTTIKSEAQFATAPLVASAYQSSSPALSHSKTPSTIYSRANEHLNSDGEVTNGNSQWAAPNLASVASSASGSPHTTPGTTSFIPRFSPMVAPTDIQTPTPAVLPFAPTPDSRVMNYGMMGPGMVHGMVHGAVHGFPQATAWPTVLNRLKVIATAYAESILASIIHVAQLQNALTNAPNVTVLHLLAQWALSGNIVLEAKLVSGLLDIFSLSSFLGTIDSACAYELLRTHLEPQDSGIFIVRIAQTDPRWLEIYGVFRSPNPSDPTNDTLNEYCATIKFHQPDPRQPATLWIDTDGNAQDSRSEHITSLAAYIAKITGWQPFEREKLQIMPQHARPPAQQTELNIDFSSPSNPTFPNPAYSSSSWQDSAAISQSIPWYELSPTGADAIFHSNTPLTSHSNHSQHCNPFDTPFTSFAGKSIEQ